MDWMDEANAYRDLIMTNIEYDILCERHGEERMDEVVELMLEAVISKRPYWESNVEMTARAFACYVKDRLPYQSDYLVGHAESCVTIAFDKSGHSEVIRAYPQGEERKAINAAFDEIVADLKLERIFTHTAEITALEASANRRNTQIVSKYTAYCSQAIPSRGRNRSPPTAPPLRF